MLRSAAQLAGRHPLATAAVATAAASHATNHSVASRREVDARKISHDTPEEFEDGWLFAERLVAPVEAEEVEQALGDIVNLGDNSRLLLGEVPRTPSDSEESVESIGHDADALIQSAARQLVTTHSNALTTNALVNPAVRGAVLDVLSDPAVQRELYRSLLTSRAFGNLMQLPDSGALDLLPAGFQGFEAHGDVLGSHELDDAESRASNGDRPSLFLEALQQLANGLDKLRAALQRSLRSFFTDAATTLKRILDEGPVQKDVAGGIMALAVACFALIMLGRLRRA